LVGSQNELPHISYSYFYFVSDKFKILLLPEKNICLVLGLRSPVNKGSSQGGRIHPTKRAAQNQTHKKGGFNTEQVNIKRQEINRNYGTPPRWLAIP